MELSDYGHKLHWRLEGFVRGGGIERRQPSKEMIVWLMGIGDHGDLVVQSERAAARGDLWRGGLVPEGVGVCER